ncbi:hypothetical protein MEQU1_001506 [Malassezia equina]|uniref:Histone deacetylase complex subunit SAP30 Sin3 binding domain-containing protein n=1 Tax=Malassezia equina TaxID=1381935 RepID=A0AAF0ED71_9BASI|nr:hypothetical protein MEQU1_001506 [Malassezia equina]
MSQVSGDASARDKRTYLTLTLEATEGTSAAHSINFADLSFDATIKYLAQHRIDPQYPPRSMVQDPRAGVSHEAPAQEEPMEEAQEPISEDQGVASRTRSSTTHPERAQDADAVHFFDRDDEHEHLAALANEHFHAMPMPKETDVIVGFLHRCRRAGTPSPLTPDAILKI